MPVRPVLALVLLAVSVGLWVMRLGERAERREEEQLRDELRVARVAVDSCRLEVARGEMAFRDHHDRVDSLRERVRGYEALDQRGVPADSYAVYMEVFERYNRSVQAWTQRADTLEAEWEACREIVRAHNVLADSVRTRLAEKGRVPTSSPGRSAPGRSGPGLDRGAPPPPLPDRAPAPTGPYQWGGDPLESGGDR